MLMSLVHSQEGWVSGGWLPGRGRPGGPLPGGALPGGGQGTELFRYVYLPREPVLESPRPYFHPVRTLGGDLVTLYRPHDHVWHKGIAWSLCQVGPENFWGGPTYVRDVGYRQLGNNGQIRHDGFTALDVRDQVLRIDELLTWVTQHGKTLITEHRRIRVAALPGEGAWRLSFDTAMRNVAGRLIRIGSPTTEGRPNAGYSGLFWRGPRSFSGGTLLTPHGRGGDELMGWRGPWLGYTGRHDGHGRASTLVFCDRPENFSAPSQWFVRTGSYACVCPAPFFSEEHPLEAGQTLELGYDVLIADGALDAARCGELASQAAEGARR
jgi:hypothetical protein